MSQQTIHIPDIVFCTIYYFSAKPLKERRNETGHKNSPKASDFSLKVHNTIIVDSVYKEYKEYIGQPIEAAISDYNKTHNVDAI